jgi:hypothetical protein
MKILVAKVCQSRILPSKIKGQIVLLDPKIIQTGE